MKKQLYIISAALMLASCTASEPAATSNFAASFTSSIEATRVSGTEWESGDQIGIMATSNNSILEEYRYNNCHNVSFTDPSQGIFTAASQADQIYYSLDEADCIDFYAYYPYSATLEASEESYPISVADQSEPRKIDFMEASTRSDQSEGYNKNSGTVPLDFSRNMAKITLILKAGDGVELSDISAIAFEGFYTSATYDFVANAFVEFDGNSVSITPYDAGNDTYSAILIPENAASHMVYFTTPHGEISIDLTEYTLTRGHHLGFTVTVSQTAATYEQNTINSWDEADISDDTLIIE